MPGIPLKYAKQKAAAFACQNGLYTPIHYGWDLGRYTEKEACVREGERGRTRPGPPILGFFVSTFFSLFLRPIPFSKQEGTMRKFPFPFSPHS